MHVDLVMMKGLRMTTATSCNSAQQLPTKDSPEIVHVRDNLHIPEGAHTLRLDATARTEAHKRQRPSVRQVGHGAVGARALPIAGDKLLEREDGFHAGDAQGHSRMNLIAFYNARKTNGKNL